MSFSNKKRKRFLIFLFIPVLIVIPFITDDLLLRIISALILVIYAAFIIFLRDTNKSENEDEVVKTISGDFEAISCEYSQPQSYCGFLLTPRRATGWHCIGGYNRFFP